MINRAQLEELRSAYDTVLSPTYMNEIADTIDALLNVAEAAEIFNRKYHKWSPDGVSPLDVPLAAQIEEAVREALEEDRKLWDAQHALDLKLHSEQAFAAAREKAAGIAENYFGKGINAFVDRIAEQIRAMEPGE